MADKRHGPLPIWEGFTGEKAVVREHQMTDIESLEY